MALSEAVDFFPGPEGTFLRRPIRLRARGSSVGEDSMGFQRAFCVFWEREKKGPEGRKNRGEKSRIRWAGPEILHTLLPVVFRVFGDTGSQAGQTSKTCLPILHGRDLFSGRLRPLY